ncbi:MAG: GntR family transcriptional regulator [Erythrobacter sp.]
MASKATKTAKKKTARVPRYLQMASELREAILAGEFTGQSFPTETVLCERFDVSRFTVREALRRLEAEGLITRRRGSGTTVQPPAARGGALHQPISNVGELLQYARGSAVVYRPVGDGPLPGWIAEQIASDTSGYWRSFSGLRQQAMGEKPIAATTAYFHERLGEAIDKLDLNASSKTLFSQIELHAGVRASTVSQDIQAIAADEKIAELLDVEPDSPVLQILRCYIDAKGQVFEISASHHPGDRFAYAMHIDVDD